MAVLPVGWLLTLHDLETADDKDRHQLIANAICWLLIQGWRKNKTDKLVTTKAETEPWCSI